jgi:hypothetical protein
MALIEVTFLLPWMVWAFIAAFNVGIFAYSLISTQNAARTVAMYASQSLSVAQNPSNACYYALEELRDAPGVGSTTTVCTGGSPVSVSVTVNTPGTSGINTVTASVSYQTMSLIPLPGVMAGSFDMTRAVEMPIR